VDAATWYIRLRTSSVMMEFSVCPGLAIRKLNGGNNFGSFHTAHPVLTTAYQVATSVAYNCKSSDGQSRGPQAHSAVAHAGEPAKSRKREFGPFDA
jgi:hypothetical protein